MRSPVRPASCRGSPGSVSPAKPSCYTSSVRRLIINADDFGLTDGINRAIVEAHARGVVTSTTLMANGAARASAIRSASEHLNLSVGCHLVLVDGAPLLDPASVTTLLGNHSNHFRTSVGVLAASALLGQIEPEQVEAEALAQIRALQQMGVAMTHFDTHKHAHIFPPLLRPLLRAAKACGIKAVRNPFGPRLPLSLRAFRQRPHLLKRFFEIRVLSAFAGKFRNAIAAEGMHSPDGSFGVISTGSLDLELFRAIIDHIPEGTWEFVCHPGYNDPDLAAVHTRLRQSRQEELRVLTSPEAREALDRRGSQLLSYGQLAAQLPG